MAQVALLHTEMNSGFRFRPRIGMNSARGERQVYIQTLNTTSHTITGIHTLPQTHRFIKHTNIQIIHKLLATLTHTSAPVPFHDIDSECLHYYGWLTNAGFDMREAGLGQVTQQGKWALSYLWHRVLEERTVSLRHIWLKQLFWTFLDTPKNKNFNLKNCERQQAIRQHILLQVD